MNLLIPVVQSVIVGLLALAGIVLTQSWTTRRDYAKRKMEFAEEVLAQFYEVADSIRYIRNPMGYLGEGGTRKSGTDESDEQKRKLDRAFVVTERLHSQEKAFSGLKSKRYRFMAMFRGDSEKPFIKIDQVVMKILAASNTLNAMREESHGLYDIRSQEFANDRADRLKFEAIIWYMPHEDTITPMVEEAVSQIAAIIDTAAKEYVQPFAWWEKWKAFAEGK